ncbi:MAG: HTH domain-containing protein [Lentimicrobium sp.]|nr:HTH domain-containing protein [Lentimicrobium sp.]
MRYLDKKQKLGLLFSLISSENTGPASKLAHKLCVSKPTVEKYLALLREDGHNIGYCTRRKTYYLINEKT